MTDPTAPDGRPSRAGCRADRDRRRRPPDVARRRRRATSPTPGSSVVATADDGPATVRRARATRPDVLVLDLNLPGLRGAEVCAALVGDLPDAGADPVGERRAAGRARRRQGGRDRLPREVGVAARSSSPPCARPPPARRSSRPGWPGSCSASSGGWRRAEPAPSRGRDRRPIPELTDRETEVLRLRRHGHVATRRSPASCSSRTAPCRTTCRTPSASCSCTTGSSSCASPWRAASRTTDPSTADGIRRGELACGTRDGRHTGMRATRGCPQRAGPIR